MTGRDREELEGSGKKREAREEVGVRRGEGWARGLGKMWELQDNMGGTERCSLI